MKYKCANCENISLKWEGRCSTCGEWGTLEEIEDSGGSSLPVGKRGKMPDNIKPAELVRISEIKKSDYDVKERLPSGIEEFDRILGGGFVRGEVVLLTGEPGVGKSTLLLQMVAEVSKEGNGMYISGEESVSQLYRRYERVVGGAASHDFAKSIKVGDDFSDNDSATVDSSSRSMVDFPVTSETNLEKLLTMLSENPVDVVVVDSIQSIGSLRSESFPGSITQVRACGYQLVDFAKKNNIVVIIVGQINKSGAVAGPKVLEHMVDAVLHMEGDRDGHYKILRSLKNRFGSTDEIGVFEMSAYGLNGVINPSQIFLSDEENVSGSSIGALVEGSRVVLVEVQALVVDHGESAGPLKRVANGINRQRVEMLTAVLSRRSGTSLAGKDVYINVSGGVKGDSPSLDLAVCAALKSAVSDKKLTADTIYVGEVSLTGGVKPFMGIDKVADDASRLGYKSIIGPVYNKPKGLTVKIVKNLKAL